MLSLKEETFSLSSPKNTSTKKKSQQYDIAQGYVKSYSVQDLECSGSSRSYTLYVRVSSTPEDTPSPRHMFKEKKQFTGDWKVLRTFHSLFSFGNLRLQS